MRERKIIRIITMQNCCCVYMICGAKPSCGRGANGLFASSRRRSFEDYLAQAPHGFGEQCVISHDGQYWEMAASLVNHGLINLDLFFENTGEFWIVWDKVRNFAPTVREKNKNPMAGKTWRSWRKSTKSGWRNGRPEALDSLRQRLAASAPKKRK